ncbi:hypothetical protein [Pseudomonas frederiksbergensis]|uniref:DUF3757 domain-containing protein n=1 Tax=Pseudomonas frederiksbergensis TaxID=104087 RepID=A0A423K3G6_9PSED|nr:hypothetical protein [Pseudomonas frederiksbergensis]RON45952.1 hypothetical protein BK665_29355 [Pseudomonas frederiksbergensis]
MKLKFVAGAVMCFAMMSTAYAATCPTVTVSSSQNATEFKFTSVLLKDKDSAKSVAICRYDGTDDEGASVGLRLGHPVQAIGDNWNGDQCAGDDASKCEFK